MTALGKALIQERITLNMKKISIAAILAALCVLFSSCGFLNDLLKKDDAEKAKEESTTKEEMYSALSSLVSSPEIGRAHV